MSKGAPKGNQFWKLRSKHGRDKIFTDPKVLEDACMDYFEETDSRNDWDEKDWVGKDAKEVTRHRKTPFTLKGLCVFLDIDQTTWGNYRKDYSDGNDQLSKDFFRVITRVEDIIYTQKFEGSVTGHFNSNIIARDLGLTDKKDVSIKDHTIDFSE